MAHHYHFGEGKALGHKIVVFAALPRLLLLQGGGGQPGVDKDELFAFQDVGPAPQEV